LKHLLSRVRGGAPKVLAVILAGALGGLAFPPVCFVPILAFVFPFLLRKVDQARTWRGAFGYGFAFGLGLHTAGLYWLTYAILIRAADFWWLVPIAAPGCALILAPFVAVPAALCRIAPAGPARAVAFAGLWTLLDMGRIFLFTGFPWNPVGSAWEIPGAVGTTMIQPAAWIGVDGLTLITVLLAVLVPYGWRVRGALAGVLVLWVGAGVARRALVTPLDVHNPAVVLVQGNVSEQAKIAHDDSLEVFRRYLALTAEGVAKAKSLNRPIAYVWPETAFPYLLDEEPAARDMIARAGNGATGIIGTLRQSRDGAWHNSVEAMSADARLIGSYDKSTLVPFGEYNPAILPFHVVPGGGLVPGNGVETWHLPGGIGPVGPLICYEVIFSSRVVKESDRPNWLVNVTNDAWYGNSAGPRQHLAGVRMRAVEEGLPIARAANTGISAVYDGFGTETARMGWGVAATVVTALPPPLPRTLFSRAGRTLPIILSLACIGGGFARRKRKTRAASHAEL